MKENTDGRAHTRDAVLERPIIIVGSPRSGTTLLGRIFSQHPDLYHLDEPRLTWRFGNDRKSDYLRPEDARPEVIEHIRNTFADRALAAGKTRIVEKTPANALRLGFVHRVFPDARFIHPIRNGYDAALSIEQYWRGNAHGITNIAPGRLTARLKEITPRRLPAYTREAARRLAPKSLRGAFGQNLWGPRIPGIQGLLRELELIEVAALQWRTCVEQACAYGRSLTSDQYFETRLETLAAPTVQWIFDSTGLPPSENVLKTLQDEFNADRPGARRGGADPAKLELLDAWINPTMTWLDGAKQQPDEPTPPVCA